MRFLIGFVLGILVGYAVSSTLAGTGFPLVNLLREPKTD
jgi:hypothetical protein